MSRAHLLEALDAHVALVESIKTAARSPELPAIDASIAVALRQGAENLETLAGQVAP